MTRRDNQQRLFPDITFTCNGFITKWIVGAKRGRGTLLPELQVWRNIGGTSFIKTKFSPLPSSATDNNIVEYIPNPPLEFHEGDILGVYQPPHQDSALVVYYQDHDGPANYACEEGNNSTVTLDAPDHPYDYPLVTVETGKLTLSIMACPEAHKQAYMNE